MQDYYYKCHLYHCPVARLTSKQVFEELLEGLPPYIGMTIASAPLICEVASDKTTFVGYSGAIIIMQSHLAFHAYPEEARLDIFLHTCQRFPPARATTYVCQLFGTTDARVTYTEEQQPMPEQRWVSPVATVET
jgi:S-adenosylmethionine/arginine decarboxylase-like enzyme